MRNKIRTKIIDSGDLANSLDAMVENLQKTTVSKDDLEAKIKERTAELEQVNEILPSEIAERKGAEEVLRENEASYQQLADAMPQIVWTARPDGYLDYYNQRWFDYTGMTFEQTEGWGWESVLHPDDLQKCLDAWSEAVETGEKYKIEYRFKRASDDEYRWHLGQALPVRDAENRIVKWFGTCTDIHEQKKVEEELRKIQEELEMRVKARTADLERANIDLTKQIIVREGADTALRESEYKLRTLLESMREGLLQVDNEDCILFVNDFFCEMIGYSSDELMGTNWSWLVSEDGHDFVKQVNKRRREGISENYEICLRKKSGEILWVIVGGAPTLDAEGIVTGSMGVFTDITERKRTEEQLLHDAFHDGLTSLANRTLFTDHLQMTIERTKRDRREMFAVLFLDFDRFKVINDSLGHAEGDNLLKQIARRLESSLRSGDLVARLGGDEFTILVNKITDSSVALRVAERIQKNLQAPFEIGGGEVFTSASIGIALSTTGHDRAEDMLRDADTAMYRAKAKGKAQHQVFDQAMHEQALAQLRIETELRQAIEQKEFCLHYQPILSLESNRTVGFESLVRWKHREFGMIPPNEFIPIAEENGLIIPLGQWILHESCRQMREWQIANPSAASLAVSVNLSFKQFLQLDLAEKVAATLKETGLDPKCLKLEITESHVMENSEKAIVMMNRLCALGVELSLDDFGTGYSSLSYLHRLPVNYLKIDRSFVTRMIGSEENSEIVHTIIKLAQNLKMKVVAEGIETAEQLAQLKILNCEYGQGYFFSKPLEAEAAETFIDKNLENSSYLTNQPVINAEFNM